MGSRALFLALGLTILLSVLVNTAFISEEEDIVRAATCGRVVKPKIYNGTNITKADAPWLVQILLVAYRGIPYNRNYIFNTGFYISNRHVLTTSDVFFETSKIPNNTFLWKATQTPADMSTCVDSVMGVPRSAHQGYIQNLKGVSFHDITGAYYIGSCDVNKISYGLMLLEIDHKDKSTPVCVPKGRIEMVGDTLTAYGEGRIGDGVETSAVSSQKVKVRPNCGLDTDGHEDLSVCLDEASACHEDYGGPVTKNIYGQQYAVAALWSTTCGKKYQDRYKHVSIGAFSSQICQVTGICFNLLDLPTGDPPSRRPTRVPPTTVPRLQTSSTLLPTTSAITASSGGYRLTPSEDRIRSEQCGRLGRNKILDGKLIEGKNAPWLVQVTVKEKKYLTSKSGFFISDRHILTDTVIVMKDRFDFIWRNSSDFYEPPFVFQPTNKPTVPPPTTIGPIQANMSTCIDSMMPVPNHALEFVSVYLCTDAQIGEDCTQSAPLPVVRAHYVGNCDPSTEKYSEGYKLPYGSIILELANPIKTITPLCIPETQIAKVGDEVTMYGVGYHDTSRSSFTYFVTNKTLKVEGYCEDDHIHREVVESLSICLSVPNACQGDEGGPVVKNVAGQRYVVAQTHSYYCYTKKSPKSSNEVSIPLLSRQICEVTGVCRSGIGNSTA